MRRLLLAATGALLIAGTGALTVPASAATTCSSELYGPVSGPVTVPSGKTCQLLSATVSGAVNVSPGGRLLIGGSTINGSVNSDLAGAAPGVPGFNRVFSIVICDSHITGSVNITRATSNVWVGDPDIGCDGNTIDGSVTLNSNDVGPELINNIIKSSVTVNSNHGSTHDEDQSAEVAGNTITGSLNCAGNDNGVSPDESSPPSNKAASKNGQCRASLGF